MDTRYIDVLEPVSAQSPCGEDLSFSPEFDRIQEARREDDPTIDYGEWQAALKQADWKAVVETCVGLLKSRSKDLRLAAWLAEGLVKLDGLPGLAQGVETCAHLIERFGAQIHPAPEEGDQERRIGTLSWFVARLAQLTRQVPLTAAPGYSLNDYEAARQVQMQLQRNPDAELDREDKVTLERFAAAVAKTDKVRYAQWLADAQRCSSALMELEQACDALFGADGPSFSALSAAIDAVHQRVEAIAREVGALDAGANGAHHAPEAAMPDAAPPRPPMAPGAITSRAQALDLLRQVAAFFRQTEPHSPVAYLAEKAVHWGSMPLHAWLRSVLKDRGALGHVEELLGVEPEGEGT